jgi:hypothetical protein
MAFLTRGELLQRPLYEARAKAEKYHRKSASFTARHHIFLSHSHHDAELVERVAELLGEYANSIYVDWKDDSMPKVTSPETARRIKGKIAETNKFILLATNNALSSKWVPWELGVADLSNTMKNVAILPITDPPHSWNGNEYIGIYSYITKADSQGGAIRDKLAVFDPDDGSAIWLEEWLTR